MRIASLLLVLPLLTACASTPAPRPTARTQAQSVVETAPAYATVAANEVPLSFDRGVWHIEGTLTMPAHTEGAAVPAIVIVHGSGPMSRDGEMRGQLGLGFGFELPTYRLLAKALARQGYAVYRYDKRTCGQFNGCSEGGFTSIPFNMIETEFATKEYVGDAMAAMDAVQRMPAIDPRRTFFVGHSEGGQLVPLLLAARPTVRAGVMLAPPFHTMTVVLEQQSERLRWAYSTIGDSAKAAKEGDSLLEASRALADIERGTYLGGLILGQPPGLWASWIDVAKKAPLAARDLDRPLLVLGGGYDYNVAPSEIEHWARWLASAKYAGHRVRTFDCVTHALNCIVQPDPSRVQDSDIGRDIHPEVIGEIATFLEASTH